MAKIEFLDWETWQNDRNAQFHEKIDDYLRDHRRVKGAGRRIFQYLMMPSFRLPVVYDVFVDFPSMQMEENFTPTKCKLIRCQLTTVSTKTNSADIEYQVVDFPIADFQKIHADLQALVLPHIFSHLVYDLGSDGTGFEFAFTNQVTQLRYHWWTIPPKEIKPLVDYCRKLGDDFEVRLGKDPKYE